MASVVKVNFAELYRSAFAEPDPHAKQQLLQQVQSLLDSWHLEQRNSHLNPESIANPASHPRSIAS